VSNEEGIKPRPRDTSQEKVTMKRNTLKVLDYMLKAGSDGAAAWEIEKATGLSNAEVVAALEILSGQKLDQDGNPLRKSYKSASRAVQALQRNKAVLFDALKAAKVKRIVCGWALPKELDVPRTDGRKHWKKGDAVGECWDGTLFCAQFEAEGDQYRTASVKMLSEDPRKRETLSLPKAVMAFALGVDDGMISSVFNVSGRSYGWWLTREGFADCADPDGVV
jgi:hypothetical protein